MVGSLPRLRVDVVPAGEALDLLAAAADAVGALAGRPLLAVDLDGVTPADAERLARAAAASPCVVVGVAAHPGPPPDLDVLLADAPATDDERGWLPCPEGADAALAALAAGVARAPQAATVLVQVLRLGRGRSLDDALTVESVAYATLQSGAEHGAWLAARRPAGPAPAPAIPAGEAVTLERRDDVLVVTIRRPEVRNAVDVRVRDGLVAAFDLAARDAGLARVELRGAGPDFCSGGDLREFGTTPDPVTGHLVRAARSPARALAGCAGRTTAFVQGACVGAGLELAALAGRVVADPGASFRLPEVAMGLVPGAGGTATVPRRVGRRLTAWMALTGAAVDAATAHRWGLVDAVETVEPVGDGGPGAAVHGPAATGPTEEDRT